MTKKNRNDRPLKNINELSNETAYSKFPHKKFFKHFCNLIPNIEEEKLEIEQIDEENIKTKGMVYVIVVDNKIFKVGHTITPFKQRLISYNCGKKLNRDNGTCSTTNYFVLQSLLNLKIKAQIYVYFSYNPSYTIFPNSIFEKKFEKDSYPPAKRAEQTIVAFLEKEFGKKPIGCTQR